MPVTLPTATPEETVRQDMRAKYFGEYQKVARGGKSMTWGEIGAVTLFTGALFTMIGLSVVPAMPLVAVIVPGIVALAALQKTLNGSSRADRKASAMLDEDINNGKLLQRYSKELLAGPEVTALRAKFAGVRRLRATFADKAAPAATVIAADAVPAAKIVAPGPKA